jgi:hypothetical protein
MNRYFPLVALIMLSACDKHGQDAAPSDEWIVVAATMTTAKGIDAVDVPRAYAWKLNKRTGELFFCTYQDTTLGGGRPMPAWLDCSVNEDTSKKAMSDFLKK